jgi:hypothetical protein
MSALQKLVNRCNEMDITEQINWLGDAIMPGEAKKELERLETASFLLLRTLKLVRKVSTLRVYMDEHGKDYRQLIDETLAEVDKLK